MERLTGGSVYANAYTNEMRFEWDEEKNRANAEKHLISFEEAATIFDGAVLTVEDDRFDYGETRYLSFGDLLVGGGTVVIVVVHTTRRGNIRIISARKASRRERRIYDAYIERGPA